MKPLFKVIYTPIIEQEDKIQIGLEDGSLEIEDADGTIRKILHSLDGTKSITDIAAEHQVSEQEVMDMIEELDEHKLIEDADGTRIATLSDHDQERYRANINYYSNFADLQTNKYVFQERLKDSTVLVLGLGGSSMLTASLAGLGVGKIIGLDYDTVELSNLNRQFLYSEDEIGTLKTVAAGERLKKINKDIEIEVHNLKVVNASCIDELVKQADIIVNGIDQPTILSTRWVNFACVKNRKPFLQGGLGNKTILWQKFISDEGGCYDCSLIDSLRKSSEFEHQLKSVYGVSFEKRNTAYPPNVAILTGLLTNEIAKHLGGFADRTPHSSTYELDTITYQMTSITNWEKHDDCPTCGSRTPEAGEPVDLETLLTISKKEREVV
ncbi:ThiF family adenylyltransferase [Pseudalkalibacillus sp. SCS-8]|uniref:HesA/MoeB/ThiF family protein n=1 Tax=Pseudalkalibacillus nanhaiensis TaxID=3115291 RepID=UPI0032DB40C5